MTTETRTPSALAGNSECVSDQLLELTRIARLIASAVNGLEDVPDDQAQIGIRDLAHTLASDLEVIQECVANEYQRLK